MGRFSRYRRKSLVLHNLGASMSELGVCFAELSAHFRINMTVSNSLRAVICKSANDKRQKSTLPVGDIDGCIQTFEG